MAFSRTDSARSDYSPPVWLASETIGASLIPALRNRGAMRASRVRGSHVLIYISVFSAVTISLSFGYQPLLVLHDWGHYPGIIVILLGIAICQWAIAVLGRFFSLSVRVAEDHKVVEKGPYRTVRHPSYTGTLLTFTGMGLAVQSFATTGVLLFKFALAYGYRIRVQERTLSSELGPDYRNYMKRTK